MSTSLDPLTPDAAKDLYLQQRAAELADETRQSHQYRLDADSVHGTVFDTADGRYTGSSASTAGSSCRSSTYPMTAGLLWMLPTPGNA